uniref:Exonuclease 1 n=1 Tax=Henneguya salminicola TaxID=69463 RepID=A0A6G3MGC3_HENSL
MGIKGLLPFLQPIHENCHISDFSGQVVAVDSYCWIHRGIFGCALDLAQGKPTKFYISYFIKRVQLLIKNGVIPLLVFDGAVYPAKSNKEQERKLKRKKYEEMGNDFYSKGDIKQAIQCYQKCIDVTPNMAGEIIQECKKLNISCIVAPYEADAQIAYLYKKGTIRACISEDSDLLAFGCEKVFYKMNNDGSGILINSQKLFKITALNNAMNKKVTFLELCVLAGCDYLASIKGIGIATACKLIQQYSDILK